MYYKLHAHDGKNVLAACDKELIGKKLKRFDYEIHISKEFYQGELATAEELKELLREHGNINLFGKKTMEIALELGLITQASIILIEDIPHAIIIQI